MSKHCGVYLFLKVRFLADLVNCRVLMPSALLEFFNLLIAATMEDDTPQVIYTMPYMWDYANVLY